MNRNILVVDDEKAIVHSIAVQLDMEGYTVFTATSAAEGLELLKKNDIVVVLSDQGMPQLSGSDFLAQVKIKYPQTIRMIISGHADFQAVTDAINGTL